MADKTIEELRKDAEETIKELETAKKQLKKPSTISFADRQGLTNKATKATAELREHSAALEGKADGDETAKAAIDGVNAALESAAKVLGTLDAHAPGNNRGGGGQRSVGQIRSASGPSQQRAPNRSGGDS